MIDIDAVVETADGSTFDRLTAIVIGSVAILAALLGAAQMDLSQKESHAQVWAARLSVQIFAGTAGGSMRTSFELNATQDAITISLNALSRTIAVFERGGADGDVEDARSRPDLDAADRLMSIAGQMGAAPAPDSPLDTTARRVVSGEIAELIQTVGEQNRQVDLAEEYGARGGRAVLGLSIVALAAVLLGLAAVLGEAQAGRVALAAAAITVALAALAGISAVV